MNGDDEYIDGEKKQISESFSTSIVDGLYLKIKTVAVTLKKEGNLEKMTDITKTYLCLIHYDKFDILPYFMLLAIERYFAFLQHPKTYKH